VIEAKKEGVLITLCLGTAKHPLKNVKERPKGRTFNIVFFSFKIGGFKQKRLSKVNKDYLKL